MRKGQRIYYRNQPGRVVEARHVTPGMIDIQLDSEDFVRRARATELGNRARANGLGGRKRRRRGWFRARQNTNYTFADSTGKKYHSDKLFRAAPVRDGASVIWSGDLKNMINQLAPHDRPEAGEKGFPAKDVIKTGAIRGRISGPLRKKGTVGVWFEVPRKVGETKFTSSWYTHMPLAWLNVEAPLGPVKVKGAKVEVGEEQAWLMEAQEAGLVRKKGLTEKELKFAKPRPERKYKGPAADSLVRRQGAALTTRPDPPRMSADDEGICGNPIDGTAYYLLVSTRKRYVARTVTGEQYGAWKAQQAKLAIATPADPWLYGGLELSLNDRTKAMLAKAWGVKTIRIEGNNFVAKGHKIDVIKAWKKLLDQYLTVDGFLQSLAGNLSRHPIPQGASGRQQSSRAQDLRERAIRLGIRGATTKSDAELAQLFRLHGDFRRGVPEHLRGKGVSKVLRKAKGKVKGKVKKQARIEEVYVERGREKELPMPVSELGFTPLVADAEGRATFELKKGEQPVGKLYWFQVGTKPSFHGDQLTALNPYDRRQFTSRGGVLARELADYLKTDLDTANAIIRSGGVRVASRGAQGLGQVVFSNQEIPSGSQVTVYFKDKARSPFFSFVFQGEGIPPQDMLAACEPASFDASGRTIKGRLQVLQQGAVRVLNRVNSSLGTTRNFIAAGLEPIRNADRLTRGSNSAEKFRRVSGAFTSLERWLATIVKEPGVLETLKVDIGPRAMQALERLERKAKNIPSMSGDEPFDRTLMALILAPSGPNRQRDPAALFGAMAYSLKSTGDLDPGLRARLQQEQFEMEVSWGEDRGKRFDREGRVTTLGAAPGRARTRPVDPSQIAPYNKASDMNWTAALIMDAFNALALEGAQRHSDPTEREELREVGLQLANAEISKKEANGMRANILSRPMNKAKRALAPAFGQLSLLAGFYYWLGGYQWAGPVNPAHQNRKGDRVITQLSQITSKLRKSALMRHKTFKAQGGPLIDELRGAISTRGRTGEYTGTRGAVERMVSDGWVTVEGKPLRSLYRRISQERWDELTEIKGHALTRRERLAETRDHPIIVEKGAEIVLSESKPGAQPFFGATYLIYKTYNPVLFRMATQNWTEANVFANPQVWAAIDGVGVYGSAMRMVQWATLKARGDVHEAISDALGGQLASAVIAVESGHPGTVARDKGKGGKFSAAALTWGLGDTPAQARELWMYLVEDPQEAMQALKVGVRFDTSTYTRLGRMRRTRAVEVNLDEAGQALIMSARRGVGAVRAIGGDEETEAARHLLSKRLRKALKILNAPQSGQTITDSNIVSKISTFQDARGLPQTRMFDSDTILEMDVVLSPAFAQEEAGWEPLQFPEEERTHYPSGSMHEKTAQARHRYRTLQGKVSTALRDLTKNLKATRGQSKK